MKNTDRFIKNVFLTFDDGIQPGTHEVLEVLQNNKVCGTFFLTGINTVYHMEENRKEVLAICRLLAKEHVVGNHSFSHAHGFYTNYYKKGLLIDNNNKRLTISQDFEKNCLFFDSLLPSMSRTLKRIARLPGRNSWNLKLPRSNNTIQSIESDSSLAVKELSADGYNLFGWDDEWKMDFSLAHQTKIGVEAQIANSQIDFTDPRKVFPKIDLQSKDNLHKDRPTENWIEVAERILTSKKLNFILLLHERAFRSSSTNNEITNLDNLIKYLKSNNINFAGLNKYLF